MVKKDRLCLHFIQCKKCDLYSAQCSVNKKKTEVFVNITLQKPPRGLAVIRLNFVEMWGKNAKKPIPVYDFDAFSYEIVAFSAFFCFAMRLSRKDTHFTVICASSGYM